jgi:hypothetical protein
VEAEEASTTAEHGPSRKRTSEGAADGRDESRERKRTGKGASPAQAIASAPLGRAPGAGLMSYQHPPRSAAVGQEVVGRQRQQRWLRRLQAACPGC